MADFFTGIFAGSLIMMGIVMLIDPYKDGQIDCINGDIKYELVEQSDKTKEWVRK